ncbi:hypothetical protein [Brevibacillus laterosporus]|uniref:hypothetical protein n=1 Tax=Brevibacillus laterosporus TaxID=1465 RepID=UPI001EF1D7A8|nr:hypothetical protein [Brevibacillus laterosporus]MCG7317914.1 hypothetical protein [Brevibacillus laterosporus]
MKEMLFKTTEGHKLIGAVVKPSEEQFNAMFGTRQIFPRESFDGLFILRTRLNRITYIGREEIVSIRPITIFDVEYDPVLGIGE